MSKSISPKTYIDVARIYAGRNEPVAIRYLNIIRRRKVLEKGIAKASRKARIGNPLSDIGFSIPLSVAGCLSPVIVRAEGMLLDNIPVAIELDAKRQHRGTAIEDVQDALEIETGRQYTQLEVLDLYRSFMVTRCLQYHPRHKYRTIPQMMERLRAEQARLEQLLATITMQDGTDSIFTVWIAAGELREVLEGQPDKSVILGVGANGAVVNGESVTTPKHRGSGMACLAINDLWQVAKSAGVIKIDCKLGGWSVGRETFQYYSEGEVQ